MMQTATDKVPNTSATAASSGADLNGAAVRNACVTLRERLLPVASELLSEKAGTGGSRRRRYSSPTERRRSAGPRSPWT